MTPKPNSIFEAALTVLSEQAHALSEAKKALISDTDFLAQHGAVITFVKGGVDFSYVLGGKKKKVHKKHDPYSSAEWFLYDLVKIIKKDQEASQGIIKKTVGFTSLTDTPKTLTIGHNGNMGNTVKTSVDPNLKIMGYPTIAELKKQYPKFKENGSPDYSWGISFTK